MGRHLQKNQHLIPTVLGYLGTLPFLLAVMLLSMSIYHLPMIGSVQRMVSVYGLVILVFMAGAHWGQAIVLKDKAVRHLPFISNAFAH